MDWSAIGGLFIGFGLVVIIPAVAILAAHQRKMAMIFHSKSEPSDEILSELRALRSEVADLRLRVAGLPAGYDVSPVALPNEPRGVRGL